MNTPEHRPADVPVFAPLARWTALSGMGRTATYLALGRGDLRAKKVGARTLIAVAHGLAWLDSCPTATFQPGRGKRGTPPGRPARARKADAPQAA